MDQRSTQGWHTQKPNYFMRRSITRLTVMMRSSESSPLGANLSCSLHSIITMMHLATESTRCIPCHKLVLSSLFHKIVQDVTLLCHICSAYMCFFIVLQLNIYQMSKVHTAIACCPSFTCMMIHININRPFIL